MVTLSDSSRTITADQFNQLNALLEADKVDPTSYNNDLYIQYHSLKEEWGSNVGRIGREIRSGEGANGTFVDSYFRQMVGDDIYEAVFNTHLARAFIESDIAAMQATFDPNSNTYTMLSTEDFAKNEIRMFEQSYHLPPGVAGLPGYGDMLPVHSHPAATSLNILSGNEQDFLDIWNNMSAEEKRNSEIAKYRALEDALRVDPIDTIHYLASPAAGYYIFGPDQNSAIQDNSDGSYTVTNPENGKTGILAASIGSESDEEQQAVNILETSNEELSTISLVNTDESQEHSFRIFNVVPKLLSQVVSQMLGIPVERVEQTPENAKFLPGGSRVFVDDHGQVYTLTEEGDVFTIPPLDNDADYIPPTQMGNWTDDAKENLDYAETLIVL